MILIRQARLSDANRMVELGIAAAEESPVYRQFGVSEPKIRQILVRMICSKRQYVGVIDKNGTVYGFLLAAVDELPFSKQKQVSDWVFYVLPEVKSRSPYLIRDYLTWAWEQKGVVMVGLSTSSGLEIEKTEELYSKMGLTRIGGVWLDRYKHDD